MIINGLIGFVGVVTDINGQGTNFGKVQIHIKGDQGDNLNQEDYLWAFVMVPTTSPAENGIGTTPNWLNKNTTVFGIFLDGNHRTIPLIIGALNQNKSSGSGISKLASGDAIPRSLTEYEKKIGVDSTRKPNYNNNKVITTSSKEEPNIINHIIEIDDTSGSERLLIKHKSGSYVEILHDGNMIIRSNKIHLVGDLYSNGNIIDIGAKNVTITAETINIESDLNLSGNLSITGSVDVVGIMTLNGRTVLTS